MAWSAVCKLLQRRSIDLLSQRNGCRIIVIGIFVTLVMLFQLGEVMITWSTEKYAAVFNPFSDNIGSQSFKKRLCLPVPIDIVYTWVNGSDPLLLTDLKKFKLQMKNDLNLSTTTSPTQCTFLHCVEANGLTVEPSLPSEISLQRFGILYPAFKDAKEAFTVEDSVKHVNLTVVMFESVNDVKAALESSVNVAGTVASLRQLYYTSDATLVNSVQAAETLIMTGFPYSEDETAITSKLTEKYDRKDVTYLKLHSDKRVAVVKVSNKEVFQTILQDKNMTVNGKAVTFSSVRIVWDLQDYSHNEDISASRFEDNEELRYSIRSVEKYAPWVRHIYVVTNGQIPSWLNMDSSRLTVVMHEEIFPNKSHLPTFSSPAIESHLHRIKGLSDKFIYLNDDVMFGKEVWPDDFYTVAGGQKVYLTWPVPNCQDGCPASWIKDGYCDKSCNNSECEWDGGDCVGSTALQQVYGVGQAQGSHWPSSSAYCSPGCANNWIADKYCDQSCNVRQCGFDAGDCGTENFHQLFRIDLHRSQSHYSAVGYNLIYLNYSTLVSDAESIDSGSYDEDPIIRSLSIAQMFKVVSFVLFSNHSSTVLNFTLSGQDSFSKTTMFNFTISLDTTFEEKLPIASTNKTLIQNQTSSTTTTASEEQNYNFDIPKDKRLSPVPKYVNVSPEELLRANLSAFNLSDDVRKYYEEVQKQYEDGDMTENGFHRHVWELWRKLMGVLSPYSENNTEMEIESKKQDNQLRRNNTFFEYINIHKRSVVGGDSISDDGASKMKPPTKIESHIQKIFKNVRKGKMSKPETPLEKVNQSKTQRRKMKTGFKSRKILSVEAESEVERDEVIEEESLSVPELSSVQQSERLGFLPWEKLGVFKDLQEALDKVMKQESYLTSSSGRRHLLDTFANSLRHVSKVYNRMYGYTARKVPAHIAHMVDRNIMYEMQAKFPDEWDETSSHRMRSSNDMQFAFAYFYFLMSEPKNMTIVELFDELDVDRSGVLSDREIRTLATRLYELPLDLQNLMDLEQMLINCSKSDSDNDVTADVDPTVKPRKSDVINVTLRQEVYYDKRMPQVTLDLITGCKQLRKILRKQMTSREKYRYEIVGEDEVAFKMIQYNVSKVVAQLDEIRKTPKKFICLNDNIDYSQDSAKLVKAVLRDFYESILPVPSKFELPKEFRNKFLHVEDLRRWWRHREMTRWSLYIFLLFLIIFACSSFMCDFRGMTKIRRFLRW